MQVRWLKKALLNLDEEAACIAAEDPDASPTAVERVLKAVAMLAEQPALGRPDHIPGTRELVISRTRYLIPYRARGDTIEVLWVFHTSRRPSNKW